MYTNEQITVLELLKAEKPSFERRAMFEIVESMLNPGQLTSMPGRTAKPFAKRKFDSLTPLPPEKMDFARRLRTLMDLDFPRSEFGSDPFWNREGVSHLALLISYVGFEHFFPQQFTRDRPIMEAVERSQMPRDVHGILNWIKDNLKPGTGNHSELYALTFGLQAKDCVRLAQTEHEDTFILLRQQFSASTDAEQEETIPFYM